MAATTHNVAKIGVDKDTFVMFVEFLDGMVVCKTMIQSCRLVHGLQLQYLEKGL
jgi:hypothetical protein